MSGVSKLELEEILTRALGSPPEPSVSAPMHDTHHKFVQLQIEKYELKKQRWEKARQSVVGTIITAGVGGFLWLGKAVIEAVQRH